MDEALIQVGLPVKCAFGNCEMAGFVKPLSDYSGWYKSRFFRLRPRKRWYCPEHYQDGRAIDNIFYENFKTPDPFPEEAAQDKTIEKLYALLD